VRRALYEQILAMEETLEILGKRFPESVPMYYEEKTALVRLLTQARKVVSIAKTVNRYEGEK
jgi:hypothetical protein